MIGYSVDVDALERHGSAVGVVAGKVRGAAAAGSRLGPDAYGVIGRVYSGTTIAAAQGAAHVIATLAGAGERTSEALGGAAQSYREAERFAARALRVRR